MKESNKRQMIGWILLKYLPDIQVPEMEHIGDAIEELYKPTPSIEKEVRDILFDFTREVIKVTGMKEKVLPIYDRTVKNICITVPNKYITTKHTPSIEEIKKEYAKKFNIKLGISDFLGEQEPDGWKYIELWNFFLPYITKGGK